MPGACCQSLMNSVLSVKITVHAGVVCIVETWLGEEITDSEISLPDYQLYRLDRNRHGGGVLMYVHKSFSCKVLLVGPSQLEYFYLQKLTQS